MPSLAFPYYVDDAGLRTLADSLGIDLPLTRESGSGRRMKAEAGGVGGELSRHASSQSMGHIHLNHLAAELKQSAAFRDVVDVLGLVPQVGDQSILSAALSHIEYMPPTDTDQSDLSERLKSAYGIERTRTVASAKRAELKQVAAQNQLVIVRGTFEVVSSLGSLHGGLTVRLTHLEAAEVVYESAETPSGAHERAPSDMPMPDGVGVEAVLPGEDAFTAAGLERLHRGTPFYGRFIGHSASFQETSGVLTCCAYAVWGMPRPSVLLDKVRNYDFLEKS
ncbi:MAG TPA: hypothetical protein VGI76_08200 [Solirubrobacteraceae bacterium]